MIDPWSLLFPTLKPFAGWHPCVLIWTGVVRKILGIKPLRIRHTPLLVRVIVVVECKTTASRVTSSIFFTYVLNVWRFCFYRTLFWVIIMQILLVKMSYYPHFSCSPMGFRHWFAFDLTCGWTMNERKKWSNIYSSSPSHTLVYNSVTSEWGCSLWCGGDAM